MTDKRQREIDWMMVGVIAIVAVMGLWVMCELDLPPFCVHFSIDRELKGALQTAEGETIEAVDIAVHGEMRYHVLDGTEFKGTLFFDGDTIQGEHAATLQGRYDGFLHFCCASVIYGQGIDPDVDWSSYHIDYLFGYVYHDLMMKNMQIVLHDIDANRDYYLNAAAD